MCLSCNGYSENRVSSPIYCLLCFCFLYFNNLLIKSSSLKFFSCYTTLFYSFLTTFTNLTNMALFPLHYPFLHTIPWLFIKPSPCCLSVSLKNALLCVRPLFEFFSHSVIQSSKFTTANCLINLSRCMSARGDSGVSAMQQPWETIKSNEMLHCLVAHRNFWRSEWILYLAIILLRKEMSVWFPPLSVKRSFSFLLLYSCRYLLVLRIQRY